MHGPEQELERRLQQRAQRFVRLAALLLMLGLVLLYLLAHLRGVA